MQGLLAAAGRPIKMPNTRLEVPLPSTPRCLHLLAAAVFQVLQVSMANSTPNLGEMKLDVRLKFFVHGP